MNEAIERSDTTNYVVRQRLISHGTTAMSPRIHCRLIVYGPLLIGMFGIPLCMVSSESVWCLIVLGGIAAVYVQFFRRFVPAKCPLCGNQAWCRFVVKIKLRGAARPSFFRYDCTGCDYCGHPKWIKSFAGGMVGVIMGLFIPIMFYSSMSNPRNSYDISRDLSMYGFAVIILGSMLLGLILGGNVGVTKDN